MPAIRNSNRTHREDRASNPASKSGKPTKDSSNAPKSQSGKSSNLRYQCPACDKAPRGRHWDRHVSLHLPAEQKSFAHCGFPNCLYKTVESQKHNIRGHYRQAHMPHLRLKCSECAKAGTEWSSGHGPSLHNHYTTVHPKKKVPKCGDQDEWMPPIIISQPSVQPQLLQRPRRPISDSSPTSSAESLPPPTNFIWDVTILGTSTNDDSTQCIPPSLDVSHRHLPSESGSAAREEGSQEYFPDVNDCVERSSTPESPALSEQGKEDFRIDDWLTESMSPTPSLSHSYSSVPESPPPAEQGIVGYSDPSLFEISEEDFRIGASLNPVGEGHPMVLRAFTSPVALLDSFPAEYWIKPSDFGINQQQCSPDAPGFSDLDGELSYPPQPSPGFSYLDGELSYPPHNSPVFSDLDGELSHPPQTTWSMPPQPRDVNYSHFDTTGQPTHLGDYQVQQAIPVQFASQLGLSAPCLYPSFQMSSVSHPHANCGQPSQLNLGHGQTQSPSPIGFSYDPLNVGPLAVVEAHSPPSSCFLY